MKNEDDKLASRGFLDKETHLDSALSIADKLVLLQSTVPSDRTMAARLLASEPENEIVITALITALQKENKLYAKIEICNTLAQMGSLAADALIAQLGCIGNNQHKRVPIKEFKKDNYPLPRDIAARTLGQMGANAIVKLNDIVLNLPVSQLSEAIDAIGFICFYHSTNFDFNRLISLYNCHKTDELIVWKLMRCCSSFADSLPFLEQELQHCKTQRIALEIQRSIRIATLVRRCDTRD